MALFKSGSFNDFSVNAKNISAFNMIKKIAEMKEISQDAESNIFQLSDSSEERGVALQKIQLLKGFEGFLSKVFNRTNEIYFVAWAWDLSGEKINLYPEEGVDYEDVKIPIRVDNIREFIGSGINLFPKRKVKGGIALRIQVWESDGDIRKFGKAMSDTVKAIKDSELNNLLTLASTVTGVSGATVNLIYKASLELANVIGTILKANGNDYVDFFEGYYPADLDWVKGNEEIKGTYANIALNKY